MKFKTFFLLALVLYSSMTFAKNDPCVYSLIDFGPNGIWIIPDAPGCGGGIKLIDFLINFFGF